MLAMAGLCVVQHGNAASRPTTAPFASSGGSIRSIWLICSSILSGGGRGRPQGGFLCSPLVVW